MISHLLKYGAAVSCLCGDDVFFRPMASREKGTALRSKTLTSPITRAAVERLRENGLNLIYV